MPENKDLLLKEVGEKATDAVKKELDGFKEGLDLGQYASTEDMEKRLEIIEASIKEAGNDEALKTQLGEIEEIVKKQGTELAKRQEMVDGKSISVHEAIEKALNEKTDELANFKKLDKKDQGLVLNLKATVTRSNISNDTMAFRVPGVGQVQRRKIYLEELFSAGRVSANNHGVIRYTDQQTLTDNSASISEGNAFPSSNITWVENNIPIQKIGDSIKVTREMMDDVDFVNSEIQNYLLRNVALTVDAQLLSGTGVSPQLVGLSQSATAFAAGSYAGTVQDANIYDLIAISSAIVQTATNFIPTAVLMNQVDAVRMKLEKDGENNYVIPTFVIPTETADIVVDGMKVVVNSGVTANTMYVGDFTRGTVYSSDDLQLEMGYENDDFTKDLVTIKARRRLALLIRSVDTGAFNYVSDIDAALAAIDDTP